MPHLVVGDSRIKYTFVCVKETNMNQTAFWDKSRLLFLPIFLLVITFFYSGKVLVQLQVLSTCQIRKRQFQKIHLKMISQTKGCYTTNPKTIWCTLLLFAFPIGLNWVWEEYNKQVCMGVCRSSGPALRSCMRTKLTASIGPATRCDATHSWWHVLKPLWYIKIAGHALWCIFLHVGNLDSNIGISQLFIVGFSNRFLQNDRHLMSFHVIFDSEFGIKNLCMPM